MKLTIAGGFPHKTALKTKSFGFKYKEAFLQEITIPDGKILRELVYISPEDRKAQDMSMLFKFGEFVGDHLMLPTSTEILFFNRTTWAIENTITHPSFNDLHCVRHMNHEIYVVNTGLEMVQRVSKAGVIVKEYNVADTDTWKRFNRDTDYRFVAVTKPHSVHVNFLFFLGNKPWITRFHQRDAIPLDNTDARIDLNIEDSKGRPHDGRVRNGYIYFTMTDGFIVVVNQNTLRIAKVIDLSQHIESNIQLGWCRGLEVIDNYIIVGLSAIRMSKFRDYGSWIRYGKKKMPARLLIFDTDANKIVHEHVIESNTGAAIFTILNSAL